MNVVDPTGWLEYLANGPNAEFFAPPIEDTNRLLVPALAVFEVFKRVLQQRDENAALRLGRHLHAAGPAQTMSMQSP